MKALGFAVTLFSATALMTPLSAISAEEEAGAPLAGFSWRNIGPAFMSGRIADIDWDPQDLSTWYVAVGSGGVWKTTNAGVTWQPIFDDQTSYSIGNVTVDPSNPKTVWVGTGEDVGGRHVGFGDGIYRSDDGGKTWQNKGLEASQHISTILVHPENSNIVWAAVHGPLWSKGGDRGLFVTTDGGETWQKTLGDDEWTGVADVIIDPRDPNTLYAATWQHHRTVAGYMGGGPQSGVHRSTDGGMTWTRLAEGLPAGNMGKIGLTISPQNPDVVYAAIELNRTQGGVWRSDDRGASWVKGADAVGGGTGPHYYQEIYASPHQFDRLYLVGPTVQKSEDGGKTFAPMPHPNQHGDMHAIVFHPTDPDYIMMGTDGGLYESFDLGDTWRYMENLPVTQYYKLALDDSEPFYNIYGGTQDNNTQGGPSRTDNVHGIRTADWRVVLGGDGHQPATEPGNPDVLYAQWQQGNITRIDLPTSESVYIKPQPAPGDPPERYNWDSPILVSPHDPTRLYFASQRVWRSDDRGDSWRAISGDLTRNQDRMLLPFMGKTWSWDAPWDLKAMSDYNTITSLAQSPLNEELLYAGTDDGLIQISNNGGGSWRKVEAGSLPGVPKTAFVNDIRADLFDADTVYVALDNHKYGDFSPYLLVSRNQGKSWKSMTEGIPDRHLVWRLVQDHERAELLFAATEFGVFVTFDAGGSWQKLGAGMPTISIRDIQIQRRENDLVAASFGRGFFVLDDYSALRSIDSAADAEATLFEPREAQWYFERPVLGATRRGSQGDQLYVADNPPYGAVLTYHLRDGYETLADARKAREVEAVEADKAVAFPGWDVVEAERREQAPAVKIVIKDEQGAVIRRLDAPAGKGTHRVAWDLKHPYHGAVETPPNWQGLPPSGFPVTPDTTYNAELVLVKDGQSRALAGPVTIRVERMSKPSLTGDSMDAVAAFWEELAQVSGQVSAAQYALGDIFEDIEMLERVIAASPVAPGDYDSRLAALKTQAHDLDQVLTGDKSRAEVGDYDVHRISNWLWHAYGGVSNSSYGPTPSHRASLAHARDALAPVADAINEILTETLPGLRADLQQAGAPWGRGQRIP